MRQRPGQTQVWRPELVIFIGLQGSGKSSFYMQRFFATHVRINLDMLKTRHRERTLLQACIAMQQHTVVDNTNLLRTERAVYLGAGRASGFRIVGYFFTPDVPGCLTRNAQRSGPARVPDKAILGAARRLQPPMLSEGFDMLYDVRVEATGSVIVTPDDRAGPARP